MLAFARHGARHAACGREPGTVSPWSRIAIGPPLPAASPRYGGGHSAPATQAHLRPATPSGSERQYSSPFCDRASKVQGSRGEQCGGCVGRGGEAARGGCYAARYCRCEAGKMRQFIVHDFPKNGASGFVSPGKARDRATGTENTAFSTVPEAVAVDPRSWPTR